MGVCCSVRVDDVASSSPATSSLLIVATASGSDVSRTRIIASSGADDAFMALDIPSPVHRVDRSLLHSSDSPSAHQTRSSGSDNPSVSRLLDIVHPMRSSDHPIEPSPTNQNNTAGALSLNIVTIDPVSDCETDSAMGGQVLNNNNHSNKGSTPSPSGAARSGGVATNPLRRLSASHTHSLLVRNTSSVSTSGCRDSSTSQVSLSTTLSSNCGGGCNMLLDAFLPSSTSARTVSSSTAMVGYGGNVTTVLSVSTSVTTGDLQTFPVGYVPSSLDASEAMPPTSWGPHNRLRHALEYRGVPGGIMLDLPEETSLSPRVHRHPAVGVESLADGETPPSSSSSSQGTKQWRRQYYAPRSSSLAPFPALQAPKEWLERNDEDKSNKTFSPAQAASQPERRHFER